MTFKNIKTNTISLRPLIPALSPALESFLYFLLYSYTTGNTFHHFASDFHICKKKTLTPNRILSTNLYPLSFGFIENQKRFSKFCFEQSFVANKNMCFRQYERKRIHSSPLTLQHYVQSRFILQKSKQTLKNQFYGKFVLNSNWNSLFQKSTSPLLTNIQTYQNNVPKNNISVLTQSALESVWKQERLSDLLQSNNFDLSSPSFYSNIQLLQNRHYGNQGFQNIRKNLQAKRFSWQPFLGKKFFPYFWNYFSPIFLGRLQPCGSTFSSDLPFLFKLPNGFHSFFSSRNFDSKYPQPNPQWTVYKKDFLGRVKKAQVIPKKSILTMSSQSRWQHITQMKKRSLCFACTPAFFFSEPFHDSRYTNKTQFFETNETWLKQKSFQKEYSSSRKIKFKVSAKTQSLLYNIVRIPIPSPTTSLFKKSNVSSNRFIFHISFPKEGKQNQASLQNQSNLLFENQKPTLETVSSFFEADLQLANKADPLTYASFKAFEQVQFHFVFTERKQFSYFHFIPESLYTKSFRKKNQPKANKTQTIENQASSLVYQLTRYSNKQKPKYSHCSFSTLQASSSKLNVSFTKFTSYQPIFVFFQYQLFDYPVQYSKVSHNFSREQLGLVSKQSSFKKNRTNFYFLRKTKVIAQHLSSYLASVQKSHFQNLSSDSSVQWSKKKAFDSNCGCIQKQISPIMQINLPKTFKSFQKMKSIKSFMKTQIHSVQAIQFHWQKDLSNSQSEVWQKKSPYCQQIDTLVQNKRKKRFMSQYLKYHYYTLEKFWKGNLMLAPNTVQLSFTKKFPKQIELRKTAERQSHTDGELLLRSALNYGTFFL